MFICVFPRAFCACKRSDSVCASDRCLISYFGPCQPNTKNNTKIRRLNNDKHNTDFTYRKISNKWFYIFSFTKLKKWLHFTSWDISKVDDVQICGDKRPPMKILILLKSQAGWWSLWIPVRFNFIQIIVVKKKLMFIAKICVLASGTGFNRIVFIWDHPPALEMITNLKMLR